MHRLDLFRGEGREARAGVFESVHDVGQVLEVPGDPVFVLAEQDVEVPSLGRGQGRVQARSVGHGCTGDRRIGKDGHGGPAALLGCSAADRDLILDRSLILTLRRVAGVDRTSRRIT
ncbi:MAG TPA: hypothetical protein VM685_11190 [Phenylobacterium sp.]|nr:hypothetical protein [Phenylobacterium sp.]